MQPPPSISSADRPGRTLVLVTHEFFPHRGGIAIYAAEMARAAQQLGYDVEVWAPALPAGVADTRWPFQVRRLPLAGNHSLLSQWRMARELLAQRDRLRSATLYIPEPGPFLAMLLLQYFDTLRPAQLLLTFHGSEIQRLASRWPLRWSTSHLLRKAARISVVSAFARDLFRQYFPAAADKVVLTPGALRTDLATASAISSASPREKLIILTVARLNPRKGQLEVIAALKALPAARRQEIEYWLVGAHSKENYDSALDQAAADADFPVKFLGDIPDEQLGAIYAQADIFAMTSMPHRHSVEGFGLVYLEAGSHGLPVVAHAIGGVPEAVIDGETGLLVAPGDSAALTAAFARLLGDPSRRRRLGEAGRTRARRHAWRDSALALFGQPPADPAT
ncbi:MAG: glycosyltransferase family 4 protein [Opitutae bacterium]|nr:glycosyltransferase family 4 protein [Opitutae bacterium]